VQQLVCADCPGCAAGDLAVLDVNVRVGVAAGFAADGRRMEVVALMLAVAAEDLPFALLLVDTNVALVIVDSAARSIRVVVGDVAVCDGTSTNVVRGEIAKHSQGEWRRTGGDVAVRVFDTGNGVVQRDRRGRSVDTVKQEDALPLLGVRQGDRSQLIVEDLAQALVIGEQEDLVPDEAAAKGSAELVADELRLGVRDRLDGTDGVQAGVANVVPRTTMELVGTAARGHVDDGARHPAVLGRVVVGLKTELAYGVR